MGSGRQAPSAGLTYPKGARVVDGLLLDKVNHALHVLLQPQGNLDGGRILAELLPVQQGGGHIRAYNVVSATQTPYESQQAKLKPETKNSKRIGADAATHRSWAMTRYGLAPGRSHLLIKAMLGTLYLSAAGQRAAA